MKRILFLLASWLSIASTNCEKVKSDPKTDLLDSLFKIEFDKLKQAEMEDRLDLGSLHFSNGMPSHIDPRTRDIIVNKNEIENYLRGKNVDTILLIKFVLSHEVAHLIELDEWGVEKPSEITTNVIPFLECEADVISGYLIKAVLHRIEIPQSLKLNKNAGYSSDDINLVRRIPNFYQEILAFQDLHVRWRSHLNNTQRITAIKEGLIYGEFVTNKRLGLKPNSHENDSAANELARRLVMNNREFGNEPYLVQDKFAWAARKALLICHGNEIDAKNLIFYHKIVKWDTSQGDLYVSYSFELYNRGEVPIFFYGLAVLEQILRSQPRDYAHRLYTDDSVYQVVLYPQQYIKLRGKLAYLHGTRQYVSDFAPGDMSKYMSFLVLPGDETSFYWTFNRDSPYLRINTTEAFDTHFADDNDFNADDVVDLVYSSARYRDDFFACARGIGFGMATSHEHIHDTSITYRTTFNEEGTIYSNGYYHPVVYGINLFSSDDKRAVNKRLNELVDTLKMAFPNFKTLETNTRGRNVAFFDDNHRLYMTIEIFYDQTNMRNYIQLNMIGTTMVVPKSH